MTPAGTSNKLDVQKKWEEKRKTCRNERAGQVAANPDNLESDKEAEGGAQGTKDSSKNCTSSVPSVSSDQRFS